MTRRQFARSVAVAAGVGILAPGCAWFGDDPDYDAMVRETWRGTIGRPDSPAAVNRELVRYATLAANSHNTQPWTFRIETSRIAILPDFARRTPVVDPNDHHLFASLGCATENIVQAAPAFGLRATPRFDVQRAAVVIELEPGPRTLSALFSAIPERQSTRSLFNGAPIESDQVEALGNAGRMRGTDVLLITDRQRIERVVEFVATGTSAQMRDRAFLNELKQWIRFSDSEAVTSRDGLFARATGNPTVPRWLGTLVIDHVVTAESETAKVVEQIRSSAGVAVFVAEADDPAHWLEAGRACQRFSLQATALDLRTAFVNQPVEIAELRSQFAAYLGVGARRPDLVVRFGRGAAMSRSLRRAIADVIV